MIILANGTNPRLGVATDYAITTLSSIFPRTLAQNIGILFTNVTNPVFGNFERDTLPDELQGAKHFFINNPLSMQKNYLKVLAEAEAEGEIDEDTEDTLDESKTAVDAGHKATLKMLAKIFNWLDGLEPQATKEITSLYNQSSEIERNISSTLARMTQLSEKTAILNRLIKESDGIKLVSRIICPYNSALTIQNVCRLSKGQRILRASSTRRLGCSKRNVGIVLSAAIHDATPIAISIARSASPLTPQNYANARHFPTAIGSAKFATTRSRSTTITTTSGMRSRKLEIILTLTQKGVTTRPTKCSRRPQFQSLMSARSSRA